MHCGVNGALWATGLQVFLSSRPQPRPWSLSLHALLQCQERSTHEKGVEHQHWLETVILLLRNAKDWLWRSDPIIGMDEDTKGLLLTQNDNQLVSLRKQQQLDWQHAISDANLRCHPLILYSAWGVIPKVSGVQSDSLLTLWSFLPFVFFQTRALVALGSYLPVHRSNTSKRLRTSLRKRKECRASNEEAPPNVQGAPGSEVGAAEGSVQSALEDPSPTPHAGSEVVTLTPRPSIQSKLTPTVGSEEMHCELVISYLWFTRISNLANGFSLLVEGLSSVKSWSFLFHRLI